MKCIHRIDSYESEDIKQVSLQLQSKLFYEEENLHLIANLLKEDPPRAKIYLEVLINCVVLIVALLEKNWSTGGIVTRRKKRVNNEEGPGAEDSEDEPAATVDYSFNERQYSVKNFLMVFFSHLAIRIRRYN